jgi:hypothetical protein
MIIWLNGAFGSDKTGAAFKNCGLRADLPDEKCGIDF